MGKIGITRATADPEYVSRLFDSRQVHTVDIQTEDWETFLKQAEEEAYISCTVVIDQETFRQVASGRRETIRCV